MLRPVHRGALFDTAYAWLFVAPALVIIFFFALYPLGYAIALSMRHVDLTSSVGIGGYVGLDNYRTVLKDHQFWSAAVRTVTFAVVVTSRSKWRGGYGSPSC